MDSDNTASSDSAVVAESTTITRPVGKSLFRVREDWSIPGVTGNGRGRTGSQRAAVWNAYMAWERDRDAAIYASEQEERERAAYDEFWKLKMTNEEIMDAAEAAAKKMGYTGYMYDEVTKDIQAWVDGRIIGWAPTWSNAETMILDQLQRNLKGIQ